MSRCRRNDGHFGTRSIVRNREYDWSIPKDMRSTSLLFAFAIFVGCTKHNPESCCVTPLQCESFGLTNISMCEGIDVCDSDGACVAPQCSMSSDCTSADAPVCVDQLCVASCSSDNDCSTNTP